MLGQSRKIKNIYMTVTNILTHKGSDPDKPTCSYSCYGNRYTDGLEINVSSRVFPLSY